LKAERFFAGPAPGADNWYPAPPHPRYSAFDWETWYEIDVLRRELTPRFAGQQP
jgi:hypothetical protein